MDTGTEPSGSRQWWFSILWGIAVLCLWCFAIVGPLLFLASVASFFADVGELQMFGRPVETLEQRIVFTGDSAILAALGLSYVIGWRKRARRDTRAKWAYMAAVYLLVPLTQVSTLAYHYKTLLDNAYFTTASLRLYGAQTGERIGLPVFASGLQGGAPGVLRQSGFSVSADGAMEISVMDTRPVKVKVGAPGYLSQDVEIGPHTCEIAVRLQRAEDPISGKDPPDR